jgi:hypothetical protein
MMVKKISIHSDEFCQPIVDAIARGKNVVLWHQLPRAGGLQEWFLIRSIDVLDGILDRGHVASAFTAYEWLDVPAPRIVDQAWFDQVAVALRLETRNRMLLIGLAEAVDVGLVRLTWIGDAEDLHEYLEKHGSMEVIVGRVPPIIDGEIIRGYAPDENGLPQSAPY